MKDNLMARIPDKADSSVIALYTDYESDEHGAYTFVLGARVSSAGEPPPGMVVKVVPASRYAVFTSRRGPLTKIVLETWKRIWAQPRTDEYARSYTTDIEVYDERAANPVDAVMEIYVAVK
jgi:predicted transcriptional regulator YdeE